jgi:hypothetical protein
VRKLLFIIGLWLGVIVCVSAATFSLADGSTVNGDVVKFDDNGLTLRTAGDAYANLSWSQLSQDSLKQLSANPKLRQIVEPFIEPDVAGRAAKSEIKIAPVTRLNRPANPSLFGGLFHSPLGLLILLATYLANLYAAYEISIIRARPAVQVIGLSAVLPLIGPAIFLAMPMKVEEVVEQPVQVSSQAPASFSRPKDETRVVEASSREDVRKTQALVFARGKFTFNKRFIETKFGNYIGEPKGDALKHVMSAKTGLQGEFNVERIVQVGATDMIFETADRGQLTVPFTDILEIKLITKPA